jgi:biopolymer transport protein TolQ
MFRILAVIAILFLGLATPVLAQNTPSAAPTERVETGAVMAPEGVIDASGETAAQTGLGIVDTFLRADIVVKSVMIVLVLASLWSWTIIFNKGFLLAGLKRKARKFEKVFWSGQSLDELYQQFSTNKDHPMSAVFIAALREWRRAFEGAPIRESLIGGVKERIEKAMNVTILRETDGLERQLGQLATIGAVAPFIGLFGTVWGIMNSFTAIAVRHDTSLASVAPGIAEALFATAAGLFAAIPAVIFYNRFVADISRYTNQLDAFADEFSAILSRQLDEKVR